MRKSYRAVDPHAVARSRAPHCARKIAQTVGGKERGAFERRNKKATCEMRLVVFDAVKLCAKFFWIRVKSRRQRLGNTREFRENSDAFPRERRHAQRVKKLCTQPRERISRHGNLMDVGECEARFLKAITDRLRGKSRRVLHAVEAFFLDRSDEPAVRDNRRRSVPVVRIDPKNIHLAICQCTSGGKFMRRDVGGTTRSGHTRTRGATRWFSRQENSSTPSEPHPGEDKPPAAARGRRSAAPCAHAVGAAATPPRAK